MVKANTNVVAAVPVARPFSLSRAMKNKEYRAVAGLAAVAAILAVKATWK